MWCVDELAMKLLRYGLLWRLLLHKGILDELSGLGRGFGYDSVRGSKLVSSDAMFVLQLNSLMIHALTVLANCKKDLGQVCSRYAMISQ